MGDRVSTADSPNGTSFVTSELELKSDWPKLVDGRPSLQPAGGGVDEVLRMALNHACENS